MMYWVYDYNTAGWWLAQSAGATATLLFGPFSPDEARLAAPLHGVPFAG